MKMPLVSVVIPSYNHQKFVQKTIQSVIDQSYENIELIIIDDGSKDDSVSVINEMFAACKARFKRFEFRSRPNVGLCATLNEAIQWCEGEYYSAIASDDILLPEKIDHQVDFLENNADVVGVFGGYLLIDESDNIVGRFERDGCYIFNDIFMQNYFLPAPTQMLRTESVRRFRYDPYYKIEDWYMWLKLTEHDGVKLVNLKDSMVMYRRHDSNMSKNLDFMYKEGMKILRQYSCNEDYIKAVCEFELAISLEYIFTDKNAACIHLIRYLKAPKYRLRVLLVIFRILMPRLKFFGNKR